MILLSSNWAWSCASAKNHVIFVYPTPQILSNHISAATTKHSYVVNTIRVLYCWYICIYMFATRILLARAKWKLCACSMRIYKCLWNTNTHKRSQPHTKWSSRAEKGWRKIKFSLTKTASDNGRVVWVICSVVLRPFGRSLLSVLQSFLQTTLNKPHSSWKAVFSVNLLTSMNSDFLNCRSVLCLWIICGKLIRIVFRN